MRIILVGFGTVGQSLARILSDDRDRLVDNYGFEPRVTTIVDNHGYVSDQDGLDLRTVLETKEKLGTLTGRRSKRTAIDTSRIIQDGDGEVLIETTPSNFEDGEPGLSHIKLALTTGKHVITSNKAPLALGMPALLELASHHNRQLLFSATVGAGTPFLSFANKSLGLEIREIRGILNGTTNYILTRMEEDSLRFEKALREAQEKGYAEENPRNDVDGYDTAAKIVIIANWVLKSNIGLNDVEITGISGVKREQLKEAAASGKKIKLIGRLTKSKATVKPEPVPIKDPVCVPGTLNALTFSTQHSGNITLIGPGAGGEQTASAILRDLIDIRRNYQSSAFEHP